MHQCIEAGALQALDKLINSVSTWQRFETNVLPTNDRLPVFCEELSQRVALEVTAKSGEPFKGAINRLRVGALGVARIKASPSSFLRNHQLLADGGDTIFAVLCLKGAMHSTQSKDTVQISCGQGFICDSAELGGMVLDANSEYWSVAVPRSGLVESIRYTDGLGGRILCNRGGVLPLLNSYLSALDHLLQANSEEAGTLFSKHIIDLISYAMGAEDDVLRMIKRRGLRAARLNRLLDEMENNLDSPALTASLIGKRLGFSARYVHLLLEDTGMSFSAYILQRRLYRVAQMIQDPANDGIKIAEIAYSVGFADISYFNRSFRRQYGDTPTGYRTHTMIKTVTQE